MLNYYRDEKINRETQLNEVAEEMRCAIFNEKDRKWYRAIVKSVHNGDRIIVSVRKVDD